MQFRVLSIDFDFEMDDLHPEEKKDIISETVGQIWEADDEDDLVEEITCATGWCIKSIDFDYVLS